MPASTIATRTFLVHETMDRSLVMDSDLYDCIRRSLPLRLEIRPYHFDPSWEQIENRAHARRSHAYRESEIGRELKHGPNAGRYGIEGKHAPLVRAALAQASVPYTIVPRTIRSLTVSSLEDHQLVETYRYFQEFKLFRLATPAVSVGNVVASILRTRPRWPALVVSTTAAAAEATHRELVEARFDCGLYMPKYHPGDRQFQVSVGTCMRLASVVHHAACPVVIYVDAQSIFQRSAFEFWHGISRVNHDDVKKSLYGIVPFNRRVTPFDEYRLASVYGCDQQIVVGPDRVSREVRVAWRSTGTPAKKNRKALDLARAFTAGDLHRVRQVLGTTAEVLDTHRKVLVLACDEPHRRDLEQAIGSQPAGGEIRVVHTLRGVDVDGYGLLIRADAGPGRFDVDVRRWGDEPAGGHPLVIVDFTDKHDPELEKRAWARKGEYERLGWFELSISPAKVILQRAYKPDEETRRLLAIMNCESEYLPPPRRRLAGTGEVEDGPDEFEQAVDECEDLFAAPERLSQRIEMCAGTYAGKQRPDRGPRRNKQTLAGTAAALPPFEHVFHADNFLRAFCDILERGDSPGPDGVRPSSYAAVDIAARLRRVSDEILADRYVPGPMRNVKVRKPSGGFRVISVANVPDRVVARALHVAIEPYVDARLSETMYGFRRRRSCKLLLAHMERAILTTPNPVLIQDDIRKAFDEVRLDLISADVAEMIPNDRYTRLITAIARGGNPPQTERSATGIVQGNSISPLLLLIHLQRRHDILPYEGGRLAFESWYADNRVTIASNEADAIHARTCTHAISEGQIADEYDRRVLRVYCCAQFVHVRCQ